MRKLLITLALLTGFALIAAEGEERQHKGPKHKGPKANKEEILKKFDKDGDGKLSEDERAAVREAMKAKMDAKKAEILAKFDKDGNGELSEDERAAAREAKKAEILTKFDKDGDGKLNDAERAAAKKHMDDQVGEGLKQANKIIERLNNGERKATQIQLGQGRQFHFNNRRTPIQTPKFEDSEDDYFEGVL